MNKISNRIISVTIVCFLSFFMYAFVVESIVPFIFSLFDKQIVSNIDPTTDDDIITNDKDEQHLLTWYYDNYLNETEQKAYQKLLKAYMSFEKEADLGVMLNEDGINKVFSAVLNDHPEIFYVSYSYRYLTDEGTTKIIPTYDYNKQQVEDLNNQLDQICKPIIEKASSYNNNYEKIKYVYDYLVDSINYVKTDHDQTIIGALIDKECVCAGYSRAMSYLLNKMNITCTYVAGYANEDISKAKQKNKDNAHAINMALIDGEYYYFDVTWGDPLPDESSKKENDVLEERYLYFGMTSSEISRHFYNDENIIQPSDSTKLNYFMINDYYFDKVDNEKIAKIIDEAKTKDKFCASFKCKNKEIYNEIKDMFIKGSEHSNKLPDGVKIWSYDNEYLVVVH